jgi:hypothetical protein
MNLEGATNAELNALARDLKIPNYVRCRMKDELRGQTATACECGIVNLQNTDQAGSHWVFYFKDPSRKIAYSSYGDPVPQELVDYLGHTPPIFTSDIQIQDFSKSSCGKYCIAILLLLADGVSFEDIVLGFRFDGRAVRSDKS